MVNEIFCAIAFVKYVAEINESNASFACIYT